MKIVSVQNGLEGVITQAKLILKQGGLVIAPSDTVYGVLVDAKNLQAVEKLTLFKNRPAGQAVSVFVNDFDMLHHYVECSKQQQLTLNQLLPGPYTVILPSLHNTDMRLESEDGNLGVRMITYPLINKLVSLFGSAVTATSANLSGTAAHYSVQSLLNSIPLKKKQMIDLIIDAGQLPYNKPSTVIDLTTAELNIIRQGDKYPGKETEFNSNSVEDTENIGQKILNTVITENSMLPIFFIIEGELGTGKTVFVKGIGKSLGITDIVSPSYVIYYEYKINYKSYTNFVHADLYNLRDQNEYKHLGLEQYFNVKNIVCFEWGERIGVLYEKLLDRGVVVYVKIKYNTMSKRIITYQIINQFKTT